MYNLDSMSNYDNALDATISNPVMEGLFIGIIIFSLILGLISIISYWKLFKKAGKPGWASIVPIYNIIIMLQIAEMNVIYFLLFLIPIANIIVLFMMNIKIAKHFGKGTGYGIGMSLIPIIFVPMLAFSDNKTTDNTTTNSDEFNAMNVINNDTNTVNPVNVEQPIPEAPVINIETENVNTLNNDNIANNIADPYKVDSSNLNTTNENNVVPGVDINNNVAPQNNGIDLNNPLNQDSLVNETNNIGTIEPEQIIPNIETNILEPSKNEIPVINNENINPTVEPINAFNSKPIDVETNNIENPTLEQNNEIIEPVSIENLDLKSSIPTPSDKKICKSCGTEMPSIVSICPNCGTDNE